MRESLPIEPELRTLIVKHYPDVGSMQREVAIRLLLDELHAPPPHKKPNLTVVDGETA